MTTHRTLTRQLTHIRLEAWIINARLPNALHHLADQTPDGYPTTATGNDTGPASNTVTRPTETIALLRLTGTTSVLDELDDYIRTARHALTLATRILDQIGAPNTPLTHLRCIGCHQWADPTRSDGQCIDCGRRTDSNQRRQRADRNRRSTLATGNYSGVTYVQPDVSP